MVVYILHLVAVAPATTTEDNNGEIEQGYISLSEDCFYFYEDSEVD